MASILMVADSLDIGGAERHVVTLVDQLARRGHDVRLLCSVGGQLLHEGVDPAAVRLLGTVLVKRHVSPRFARFVSDELDRRPADIVHAHMFASAAAAANALDGHSCPLVVTEHSEGVWRSPADEAISRGVYRRSAAVIAVSAAIAHRLISVDGVPEDHIWVIPNAVAVEPNGAVRGRNGVQTVGVVARLRPEKGVEVFLRAAAIVSSVLPRTCFVVVGDGPEAPRLRQQAADLGLGGHLRFLGANRDGPRLLAQFDVLAVPSLANEGTPLVVLEALATGVPLVASRTGGIPEQVRDGIDGLLVEPADADALAVAITGVLRDRDAARRRAAIGATSVRQRFPLEGMVRSIEAIYQSLIDAPSGRAI